MTFHLFPVFFHHLTKSCEALTVAKGRWQTASASGKALRVAAHGAAALRLEARARLWCAPTFEPLIPIHYSGSKARHPASRPVGHLCYLSAFTEVHWAHSCHSLLFPSLVNCSLGKVNVVTPSGARHRVFPFWEQCSSHCSHKVPFLSFCLVSC